MPLSLAEFVESGLEAAREFFGRAAAPIVKKNDHGAVFGHVMMNGDHVEAIFAKSFQDCCHFVFEHGHITGYRGIFLCADKRSPSVETHTSVDGGAMFFH